MYLEEPLSYNCAGCLLSAHRGVWKGKGGGLTFHLHLRGTVGSLLRGWANAPQATMEWGHPLPFLNFPYLFSWNNANTRLEWILSFSFLGCSRSFPQESRAGAEAAHRALGGPIHSLVCVEAGSRRPHGSALVPPLTNPLPFHPVPSSLGHPLPWDTALQSHTSLQPLADSTSPDIH